jgi:Flp pilus assembly pilin Flp
MLPKPIARFLSDESGTNVVEYAVLSCVMAVVVASFAASGMSLASAVERMGVLIGGLVSGRLPAGG